MLTGNPLEDSFDLLEKRHKYENCSYILYCSSSFSRHVLAPYATAQHLQNFNNKPLELIMLVIQN